MIRRRLGLILGIAILGAGLAALVGSLLTPQYKATTAILIEPLDGEIVTTPGGRDARGNGDPTVVDTQIAVMTSSSQIESVMREMSLLGQTPPAAAGGPALAIEEDDIGTPDAVSRVTDYLPESWLVAVGLAHETEDAIPAEAPEHVAIDGFRDNLLVERAGDTMVINVSYTSPDPDEAAEIANAVAGNYLESQLGRRLEAAEGAADWFEGRLSELQETVRRSEQAAIDFRLEHGLGGPVSGRLNEQAVLGASQKLETLRAARSAKLDLLSRAKEARNNQNDLDALAETLASPLMNSLLIRKTELLSEQVELAQTYGARHPLMVRLRVQLAEIREKMAQEASRSVRNLEQEIGAMDRREAEILEEIQSIERSQGRNQQLEVQLGELERQAAANRDHYEALIRRSKLTQERQKTLLPQARVISPAVPPRKPTTPSASVFAFVGFVASSMLGVALSLILERMNGRIRSGADLKQALGLPVLGLVPRLPSGEATQYPARYIVQKPLSGVAEAAFSILTSVRSAREGKPPATILVTSALASEGKTTLSVTLAATASMMECRTLLVELDLRRPTLNERLGGYKNQPGLAEYLIGRLRRDQLIQRDPHSEIEYIPAGLPPALPPALLTGSKIRDLIESLKSEYDCIILDSAPVLAVTEARIMGGLADRVILAARWRESYVSAVIDAVSALDQHNSTIAGCVLTDIDMRKYKLDASDRGRYYTKSQQYYTN